MNSRQQRRQRQQAMAKRGDALLKAGLFVAPETDDLLAVTSMFATMLRAADDDCRAGRVAGLMHQLSTASARSTPGTAKLACAKGCNYCCHTFVAATAPEIFHVAASISVNAKRKPSLISGIVERSRRTAQLATEQRFGAQLPCPLLFDGICSQYRERPSVCRQVTSFDLGACIEEYNGQGFGTYMKVSSVHLAHVRNSRVPLLAALKIAGLPATMYEFSGALVQVLETIDAEKRWLAGDDVFVGVQRVAEQTAVVSLAQSLTELLVQRFAEPG